ncbi:peptidase [Clostridia bacterium]|nr:peptidase [Clostridia bacterium]
MKRRIKVALAALMLAAVALSAFACAGGEIAKHEKNVNQYTIDASYDSAAHEINANYKLSYINNTEIPLTELKLHLYPNAYRQGAKYPPVRQSQIDKAYPSGIGYGDIGVTDILLNGKAAQAAVEGEDKNILRVTFPAQLYPTARYTLECKFKLKLAKINHRLGYNDVTVNLGNWYPVACVYENGAYVTDPYYNNGDCFYSDIANYEIDLKAAADLKVAATGNLQVVKEENNFRFYKIKASAVRDFAIVMSSQFETKAEQVGDTLVTYYYYKDADPARSLKTSADALKTFNELFGKYPYKTLAVVKTAFLQGGMEYPNLVYISDAVSADYFQEVIVHEIAHQWWYGLVGNNEVKEAWLDEGLADYSTTLFFERNEGYNIKKSDRIMEALKSYLLYVDIYQNLTGQIDTSMNRSTNAYKDEYEYVYMTYVKGELLFDNLRTTVGDDAFFRGLKKYYDKYKFTNVSAPHLIGAFEGASGKDLGGFFKSWIEGKIYIADLY